MPTDHDQPDSSGVLDLTHLLCASVVEAILCSGAAAWHTPTPGTMAAYTAALRGLGDLPADLVLEVARVALTAGVALGTTATLADSLHLIHATFASLGSEGVA